MIHLENKFGIKISTEFVDFVEQEVLPETTIVADKFWAGLARLVKELTPTNKQLLERRSYFQHQINQWHEANKGREFIPLTTKVFYIRSATSYQRRSHSRSTLNKWILK